MTVEQILKDREKTHGKYEVHAHITQLLKGVMRNTAGSKYEMLSYTAQEALDMTAHKIGRILAGDPNEPDHWQDIAGYNTLEVNQIHKRNELMQLTEIF